MKLFKVMPVIAFMLIYYCNCSAQMTRNTMISYYKVQFLYKCMDPFLIDTGYQDVVCSFCDDIILDKKSVMEIDSTSKLIGEEIRLDVESFNVASSGNFYPSRLCVLNYCINQYESKDMDKMAKGFAMRMKKVKPLDYKKY